MASATLLFLAFGRRIGLRERLLVGETIGVSAPGGVVALIRRVALFTLVAELVGASIFLARFVQNAEPGRAVWMAYIVVQQRRIRYLRGFRKPDRDAD